MKDKSFLISLLGIVILFLHTVNCTSSLLVKEFLTIAGNFSLNGKFTNLAEYDLHSGEWSNNYEPELYVYGESNGVLWNTLVNRSSRLGPGGVPVDELVVVGEFDTVSKTSQMLYCSVGVWTGISFDKLGEGLCPRGGGSSSGMVIQTSTLGSDGDLFVGGAFESRVWDGNKFVDVFNVAYFQGSSSSWLPLQGGKLTCKQQVGPCEARVSALEWDPTSRTLFIGGKFNYLGKKSITSGLCMWSERFGMVSFSSDLSNGLSLSGPEAGDGEASVLTYDCRSQSLFVAGSYSYVAGMQCSSIAVWHRPTDSWTCLDTPDFSISTVTAMRLDRLNGVLYLAGWASFLAKWQGREWGSPYAISRIYVQGYIEYYNEHDSHTVDDSLHKRKIKKGQLLRERNHRKLQSQAKDSVGSLRGRIAGQDFSDRNLRRTQSRVGFKSNTHSVSRNTTTSNFPAKVIHKLLSLPRSKPVMSNNRRQLRSSESSPRHLSPENFTLEWDWLPGFSGGNGPIFSIVLGRNKFKDCLFISGAFNNGPPIVLWTPPGHSMQKSTALRNISTGIDYTLDCTKDGCVFPVGSNVNIYGLITSVSQLKIPVEASLDDQPHDPLHPTTTVQSMSTLYVLFIFSVSIGICLGITITFRCMKIAYERVPTGYDPLDDDDDDDDEDEGHDGSEPRVKRKRRSLTLGTLSTGGNRTIDLKACYEKAMAARHLSTAEVFVTINPQEVELTTRIGEGSFGTVWAGKWRNNNVAVKEFGFAQSAIHGDSQQSESLVEEIIGEAGLMTCLRHPKILQLYGCTLTPQAVWIVCELCERGSLRMLLDDADAPLSNEQKLSLCMDVADGMQYLHHRKKPIIHRDLKSHNVFIIESSPGKYVAKIGDWGSARAIALSGTRRTMTQGVGTACWLAPEAIKQSHFSKASDVYSFGIVLWEIYTRRRVHIRLSDSQIIARVANEGLRPEVPVYCPWSELMQKCWSEQPSSRPSFKYIVDTLHHIFNQVRSEGFALTARNLNIHDANVGGREQEQHFQRNINRIRNYCYSDDSNSSRDIGNSF